MSIANDLDIKLSLVSWNEFPMAKCAQIVVHTKSRCIGQKVLFVAGTFKFS